MSNRPPSSAGNRPISGMRPFTSQRPSASSGLPSRAGPPGTASRLISTASMRGPGSRGGSSVMQTGVMPYLSVTERPMSQQGLVTPKTSGRMSQRQVQDKSYYMGLLRAKISELRGEISRLSQEMDSHSKEQATFLTYEKRAETLASELKDMQGELADYNLLVDKLNTDAEPEELNEEYKELVTENQHDAEAIDHLFEQRQEKESQIKSLEAEIEQERHLTDNLLTKMKPELKQKYNSLKAENMKMQSELEQLQGVLDSLASNKANLDVELSSSRVKQEAIALFEKLRELEERREILVEEERQKGTPAQEREKLLHQVKENNAELASIERQTTEVREQIARAKDELSQLEQDLEDQQGEKSSKYRELRKREETMDTFLSSFDETKHREEGRQAQLEQNIVGALERIGRHLSHFQHLPSPQELAVLKDDLVFKEGEMEKSRSTVSSLGHEQKKLNMDLGKIEQLETKIQQELEALRLKIQTMEEETKVYIDLDKVKQAAEEKKRNLTQEYKMLQNRSTNIRKVVEDQEKQYNTLQQKLQENETFVQLSNLEKRLQGIEQSNFAIKEIVASKLAETDYNPNKNTVLQQRKDLNKMIQDALSKGSTA